MSRLRGILSAISCFALFGAGLAAAPAGAQAQSKCLSSQLKAGAASAVAQARCEAKAAAKGQVADPACLAKAVEKAGKALAKAESKDDCIVTGSEPVVSAVVDDFVANLVAALNPPPVVCCENAGACLYAPDAATCTDTFSATAGAPGSVCTGNGSCAAPPAAAGPCCQDANIPGIGLIGCVSSATLDMTACGTVGGTFSASAICTPAGMCQ